MGDSPSDRWILLSKDINNAESISVLSSNHDSWKFAPMRQIIVGLYYLISFDITIILFMWNSVYQLGLVYSVDKHGPDTLGYICLAVLWLQCSHGPLTRYAKLWDAHVQGMLGTFSPPLWVSDHDMHHGTCVTHVSWCMPGSLISIYVHDAAFLLNMTLCSRIGLVSDTSRHIYSISH